MKFLIIPFFFWFSAFSQEKPRVIILTDIENEPDDAMSLVRYLLYSNQFDTEAIVATTSIHQPDKIADWRIYEILDAYEKVQPNLNLHEKGFPSALDLRKIVKKGIPKFGLDGVGDDRSSEGSNAIVEALKKEDQRPLWVLVWGGPNVLAQALFDFNKRGEDLSLLDKLRVYTISDQDNSGPWIRKTFPSVFYVVSPGTWAENKDGYYYSTWSGIAGERHYSFATGADTSIVGNSWVDKNIQNHGPLGKEYPDIEYIMEGDSPSFLFLINNGLNVPERPSWGGWGGRYELYTPKTEKWFWEEETRPIYTNAVDKVLGIDGRYYSDNRATIWRWRDDYQNDFAARIDWTIEGLYKANHPPQPMVDQLEIYLKSDESVTLNGKESYDIDSDELTFNWFIYYEAGSTFLKAKLTDEKNSSSVFTAPKVANLEEYHVILRLTDSGNPALTRYKRIRIYVEP